MPISIDKDGREYSWDETPVPEGIVNELKPVMTAVRFSLIAGQQVFDAIQDGADAGNKSLRYMRFLLDQSTEVNFNDPEIYAMVESLVVANILTQEKFDELLAWKGTL